MNRGDFLRALARACLAGAAWAAAGAIAGPVGDALDRPALRVAQPGRVVLLAAASAGPRLVAVGERGVVALSDDGGGQWRQVVVPTSVTLTAVRFADEQRGVAVGHGGVVLVTEDGGQTWARRLDGRQAAALALQAARRSGMPQQIKAAERLAAEGADKPFLDVLQWDAQRFLAVGAYGIAFATEDAGRSWTPWMDRLPNDKGYHLYAAGRSGNRVVLAGEQGLLLLSSDAGRTFQTVASPYKGSWFAATMRGDDIVLAGLRGNVWRSTDAGRAWSQIANPGAASITALLQEPGGVLLANQAGVLLRLRGATLAKVNAEAVAPLAGLVAAQGKLFGVGVAGVVPLAGEAK